MDKNELAIPERLLCLFTPHTVFFPGAEAEVVINFSPEARSMINADRNIIIGSLIDPDKGMVADNFFPVSVLGYVKNLKKNQAKLILDIAAISRIRSSNFIISANQSLTSNWSVLPEKKPALEMVRSDAFQKRIIKAFAYLKSILSDSPDLLRGKIDEMFLDENRFLNSVEELNEQNAGTVIDGLAHHLNSLPILIFSVISGQLQEILAELDIMCRLDLLEKLIMPLVAGKILPSGVNPRRKKRPGPSRKSSVKDPELPEEGYKKQYEKIKGGLPPEVRTEIEEELTRLERSGPFEEPMICDRLDWLINLPWNKFTEDTGDLNQAMQILNKDHSDLEMVKNRILEYLAVRSNKGQGGTTILCFVGPPGVGKTSLGKSIARALGRKFVRLSLGGLEDEKEVRGHRKTYVNAVPGRILEQIRRAGSANPVFMLDEVDKIGKSWRGDPASALLEVLDPEQNKEFYDAYIGVPFDLSKVFFICTANTLLTIPDSLRDRMEVIELPGYVAYQKLEIAVKHLIPRQRENNGFPMKSKDKTCEMDVLFSDEAILDLIEFYTQETGVRQLERKIGSVYRAVAKMAQLGETENERPIEITKDNLAKFCGRPDVFPEQVFDKLPPGCAPMVAVSDHGGHLFYVEAEIEGGRKRTKIKVTGVRGSGESKERVNNLIEETIDMVFDSLTAKGGILEDFKELMPPEYYLHVHIRNGSVLKDGPSAGIPILWALYGLLTNQSIRPGVVATGETDLKIGTLLPVGRIRDKTLAVHRAGFKKFIIPKENEGALDDIPPEIRKNIEIKPLSSRWEALLEAFPDDERIVDYINQLKTVLKI